MIATILIVAAIAYLLPTLIAVLGGKRNSLAIFALNLLGGWTAAGWLWALVWSLTRDPAPQTAGGPFPAVTELPGAIANPMKAARTELMIGGGLLLVVLIGTAIFQ